MRGHFILGDIFDENPDSSLMKTRGTWDVINAIMFLHQFDWNQQVEICSGMLKLLKPKAGSMVIGAQTGSTQSGEVTIKAPFLKEGNEKKVYRHSKDSFRKMWEQVAESEGVKLEVWVEYTPRYELGEVEEEQKPSHSHAFLGDAIKSGSIKSEDQRRLIFDVTIID